MRKDREELKKLNLLSEEIQAEIDALALKEKLIKKLRGRGNKN